MLLRLLAFLLSWNTTPPTDQADAAIDAAIDAAFWQIVGHLTDNDPAFGKVAAFGSAVLYPEG